MSRKILLALLITIICVVNFTACSSLQTSSPPEPNLPNPASVYCEQQGYKLEIRTAADGSQSGVCIFPDGRSCDEWAYFHGECGPTNQGPMMTTSISTTPQKLTADMLVIETYGLIGAPDMDTLQFTSVQGHKFTASEIEISTPFLSRQSETTPLQYTVTLNGDTIIAEEFAQNCEFEYCINVTRNGKEIFQTDAGGISPITALQNLWAYDNHWVLETNLFLEDKPFNGQIFVDGTSLNQQYGYEEAFNFQTINGRPFYFFRRNGKVDAWFDGQEISLGYDDVPHYRCCSESAFNPRVRQGAVLFFGTIGDTWYFVRILAPDVLKQLK
jgi:putative hemolysin